MSLDLYLISCLFFLLLLNNVGCDVYKKRDEAVVTPSFFKEYHSLGQNKDGAFFELGKIGPLIDGKFPSYEYEYNYASFHQKGIIYQDGNMIYVLNLNSSDSTEGSKKLLFDFSMKKGDTVRRSKNLISSDYDLVLEDIFADDEIKDEVFKFRMHFESGKPDIVHMVTLRKGILSIYSCFHNPRYETKDFICYEFDDILFFVGYGYFHKLNPHINRYE